MIEVLYFARFREILACDKEHLELADFGTDVGALMQFLAQRGSPWTEIFSGEQKVMVAVNQEMVSTDITVNEGDEVAFFPPVTGG